MSILIDMTLLGMLVSVALATVFMRSLFGVIMLFGIYSFLSAGIFLNMDAPDVALTEAAIGAGVTPVLMLVTLALVRTSRRPQAKTSTRGWILPFVVVLITGGALLYGTLDMPSYADPAAPAHHHVAPRYVQDSVKEIGIPNMVTSVLASYRGYDTLGEVFVIFTAGIGVMALLGALAGATGQRYREFSDTRSLRHHTILHVVAKVLIPFVLVYALYVQFHGEYSPGGGFQAGVIFAAAIILYAMVFGLDLAMKVVRHDVLRKVMAAGPIIYAGTGVVCMLSGGAFLEYTVLNASPQTGQQTGIILIEIGVLLTVAAVMLSVFFNFAGRSELRAAEKREWT